MAELPFLAGEQCRGPILVLLFFISAAVVTGWGIWEGTLPRSEEAVMAEIAREIVVTDDGWTMHFDGEPVYDTPPLALWLMAAFFKIFGATAYSARLPFVLFAVLTFYITFRACIYSAARGKGPPDGITRSRTAGLLSAIILAASPLFAKYAPHVTLGIPFAFFVALSVLGVSCLPERRYGLALWGVGVAGGMLAAGAWGLLVIPGSLLALVFCRRCRTVWRSPAFIGVTLVAILAGGSWLLPAALGGPGGIRSGGLWKGVIGTVHPQAGAFPSLFRAVKDLWIRNLPWSIPLTAAVIRVVFFRGRGLRGGMDFEVDYTLLSFALVLFVPAALARPSGLDAFLPLLPISAMLSAREIARWLERPGPDVAEGIAGPVSGSDAGEASRAGGSSPCDETDAVTLRKLWSFNQAMTAIFCLLMLLLVATPLRLHRSYDDPVKEMAAAAERMTQPGTRLGNFRQDYRVQAARLLFYGNRSLDRPCRTPDEVTGVFDKDKEKIFLSTFDDMRVLQETETFPYRLNMIYRAGDLVLFGLDEGGGQ